MKPSIRLVRGIFASLASLAFVQCVSTPRDGDTVNATNQVQHFEGLIPESGGTVQLQVLTYKGLFTCPETNGWENVTTVTASTTINNTDPCGVNWYKWQKDVTLKNGAKYWCEQAHFGYQSEYRGVWQGVPMAAFPPNAESTCHPTDLCGQTVINQCSGGRTSARLLCIPNVNPTCKQF